MKLFAAKISGVSTPNSGNKSISTDLLTQLKSGGAKCGCQGTGGK